MQIESFTFRKNESYATERPSEFTGKVVLSGPTGKQEVVLQTQTLVQVFSITRADLIAASRENAEMTKIAIDEAIHGPLLESSTQIKELA